ncbi:MAG: MBL fold metallo-hydrolase [Bryobacter sp.]|nr:MBL fold metallo-hydrolase [Bryobacter sp.]
MAGKLARRALLWGGAGVAGVAAAGVLAYRAVPTFWRQFAADLKREILPPRRRPDPRKWPDTGLHAAWLGHATVLVKMDGYTLITDPVLFDRCGLDLRVATLGLKRLVAPALEVEALPHVDLVLLSHAHMDHLDTPTLRALASRSREVVTAHATSDLIDVPAWKNVRELAWNEEAQVGPLRIRAIPVRHWGARMRRDDWRGYNGYVIESGRRRVLFAGDTAETDTFRALRTRRDFDLALMPIGAYNPWIRVHCNPEQAWRMAEDAGAPRVMPIHHQTFPLSREPFHEPIERMLACARGDEARVAARAVGDEVTVG